MIARREPRAEIRGGFTLMELMVVVAIIVVLVGAAVPIYLRYQEDAMKGRAKIDVKTLSDTCKAYQAKYGEFPASLDVLTQPGPEGELPYLRPEALIDPWKRPYQYQNPGTHNAAYGEPDVWSTGPKPNDAAGIIGNWAAGQ